MRNCSFLLPLFCVGILTMPGCQLMRHDQTTTYQTVEANPRRDTEEAEEQHQAAVEIIDRYLAGKRHHADLQEAEEYLQAALVADVTHAPSHNSLGVLYLWQHKLYLAAWEFEYAHKLVPWTYEPLHNLGMVYDTADRPDQAVRYYLMAYENAPNNAEVIGNLARAQLKRGDSVEAVRPLLEQLKMVDDREEWLAWASEQLGLNPIQVVSATSSRDPDSQRDDDGLESDTSEEHDGGALRVPPVPPESSAAAVLMLDSDTEPANPPGMWRSADFVIPPTSEQSAGAPSIPLPLQ